MMERSEGGHEKQCRLLRTLFHRAASLVALCIGVIACPAPSTAEECHLDKLYIKAAADLELAQTMTVVTKSDFHWLALRATQASNELQAIEDQVPSCADGNTFTSVGLTREQLLLSAWLGAIRVYQLSQNSWDARQCPAFLQAVSRDYASGAWDMLAKASQMASGHSTVGDQQEFARVEALLRRQLRTLRIALPRLADHPAIDAAVITYARQLDHQVVPRGICTHVFDVS